MLVSKYNITYEYNNFNYDTHFYAIPTYLKNVIKKSE